MTDLTVANTIIQQLGGRRFSLMTGAKDFLGDANSVKFQLPKAARKIKGVKITLGGDDLYTMSFGYVCRKEWAWKEVAVHTGVYADQLVPIFEKETGLYTKL